MRYIILIKSRVLLNISNLDTSPAVWIVEVSAFPRDSPALYPVKGDQTYMQLLTSHAEARFCWRGMFKSVLGAVASIFGPLLV